jgi:hypothetical protein
MAEEEDIKRMMDEAIIAWAERNNSLVVQTPSARYYALFFEPDGEGPRMQFMGSNPVRAWAFIRNHPLNRYK